MANIHNIPAGFPYSFVVKMSRAVSGTTDYTDITNPINIPGHNWKLCFVDGNNNTLRDIDLEWDEMSPEGYLSITLTGGDTLALAGRRVRIEVCNNEATSNLLDNPTDVFYFIPNTLHTTQE